MPTYEYACRSCGEHLEVVQAFTDDALETCPACGGSLRKVFGNVGIVFKGSGFYKTDSRKSSSAHVTGSSESSGDGGADKAASSDAPTKGGDTSTSSGDSTPAKTSSDSPAPASPSTPAPATKPVAAAS